MGFDPGIAIVASLGCNRGKYGRRKRLGTQMARGLVRFESQGPGAAPVLPAASSGRRGGCQGQSLKYQSVRRLSTGRAVGWIRPPALGRQNGGLGAGKSVDRGGRRLWRVRLGACPCHCAKGRGMVELWPLRRLPCRWPKGKEPDGPAVDGAGDSFLRSLAVGRFACGSDRRPVPPTALGPDKDCPAAGWLQVTIAARAFAEGAVEALPGHFVRLAFPLLCSSTRTRCHD